jgi:hypothetical protein
MIHPDDTHCFPVCLACREADVCYRGPVVPPKPPPSAGWAPNTLPLARLKCGCISIPWPLWKVFKDNIEWIICDRHGLTTIAVEKKPRKTRKDTNPNQDVLDDVPPF